MSTRVPTSMSLALIISARTKRYMEGTIKLMGGARVKGGLGCGWKPYLFVISEGRLHDETELLSRAGEEKRANNIRKMAQADV